MSVDLRLDPLAHCTARASSAVPAETMVRLTEFSGRYERGLKTQPLGETRSNPDDSPEHGSIDLAGMNVARARRRID